MHIFPLLILRNIKDQIHYVVNDLTHLPLYLIQPVKLLPSCGTFNTHIHHRHYQISEGRKKAFLICSKELLVGEEKKWFEDGQPRKNNLHK